MGSWEYYAYLDITSDGRVFYVGKGTADRLSLKTRNQKHSRIVRKHGIQRVVVFIGSEVMKRMRSKQKGT